MNAETLTAIVALLTPFFTGLLALLLARLNKKTDNVAKEGAADRDKLLVVAKETHKLVDGAMAVQMKIAAVALRRIADMRPDDSDDAAAADMAETALSEHETKLADINAAKEPPR